MPVTYAEAVIRARAIVCDRLMPRIPGLQVAIGVNGRLAWSEGFGYADRERNLPVTNETQFRIGSVSKPLTAAALARLYELTRRPTALIVSSRAGPASMMPIRRRGSLRRRSWTTVTSGPRAGSSRAQRTW